MYLLVIVLNREEFLESILTAFVEADISGATIVDSVGMGRVLAYDVPLFAGLRATSQAYQSKPYNKTVFTVIKDKERLDEAVKLIEDILNLDEPGAGLLFAFPLSVVKGLSTDSLAW